MAAGGRHSLAVGEDGSVWSWGSNEYGQLGLGDLENRGIPHRVPGFGGDKGLRAVAVTAGYEHSHITAHDSLGRASLYAMGRGADGRLGSDDWDDALSPLLVPVSDKFCHQPQGQVIHVASGRHHTIAFAPQLDETEPPRFPHPPIFGCGANAYGQLSVGDSGERHEWCFFVGMRGTFVRHLERDGCAMLAAGSEYSVLVTKRGGIWVCGRGDQGQLGLGSGAFSRKDFSNPQHAIFHFQEVGGAGGELLTESFLNGRLEELNHPPSVVYEDVYFVKR